MQIHYQLQIELQSKELFNERIFSPGLRNNIIDSASKECGI
ncbi:MAG TPA: hypothetical protein PLU70_07560 [Thermotogota bacterium]|nr:hypothetical protein [Thermotogota bacterium]HOM54902.1 hypothetical protein [Thermotogota bacterium]HPL39281.1 hypothetical protein [Thermotogota bacterium]HQG98405.1 hypothetical protein [Thermotogota bacterium]HQI99296.1 hypothetical protein [Thermotogota bacterium]